MVFRPGARGAPNPLSPARSKRRARFTQLALAGVAGAALLVACGGSGIDPLVVQPASLAVLSSAPEYVSGGDARIEVQLASEEHANVQLFLNGKAVQPALVAGDNRLEGVVEGLQDGDNTLELRHNKRGLLASLKLKNHPITGPMFAGPKQEPFVCTVVNELGQEPIVDTTEDKYFAVRDAGGQTIGYSRNCSVPTTFKLYYMPTTGKTYRDYKPMPADGSRPADLAKTRLLDGREVDFIVRYERGTINRYIYQYVMLAPFGADPAQRDASLWNKRLVYHFQGGVGFGHHQGRIDMRAGLEYAVGKGYAVAYSTGNRTGEHYDLIVGGETAMMTKEGFIERYGVPTYTVGVGASGGAIQQYVYSQNHPGLIDAGVASQPYPDMVGQMPHVGDCELLEYYMDVTDRTNAKWAVTKNRSWLVGMNAEDTVTNPYKVFQPTLNALGFPTNMANGSTECRKAWQGLTAGAMNPKFDADNVIGKAAGRLDLSKWPPIPFGHFDDARNVYGLDEHGYPRSHWDNVGVQYGLQALKDGRISTAEFLDLNLKVGGWKHPKDMVAEGFPYYGVGSSEQAKVVANVSYFDPWGYRNMNRWNPATPDVPAPRTTGSLDAIRGAYSSGLVFQGGGDIPIIDWHPYLEHKLDMHNVHQSFAIRKRIQARSGSTARQAIWMTETRGATTDFDQVPMGLEVIDEWMANIRANPGAGVAGNRPARAVDSCFDKDGKLMSSGPTVWDGIIDPSQPKGACATAFPTYTTSRIVAGAPLEGGIFKCALKSVDAALADGTYGTAVFSGPETARLKTIFATGVCDYSKPDAGKPAS